MKNNCNTMTSHGIGLMSGKKSKSNHLKWLLSVYCLITIMIVALMTFSCQSPKADKVESTDSLKEEIGIKMEETFDDESEQQASNMMNDYDFVDLGLPSHVKWATCNIGTWHPSESGFYFAWGETNNKQEYTTDNSLTEEKELYDFSGDPSYDAATANWGSPWRTPTKEEMSELVNKCQWELTTQDDCKGYRITGPNGNSIFLPAAGAVVDRSIHGLGDYCKYWTSSPDRGDIRHSTILFTFVDEISIYVERRMFGLPIRPVFK